MYFSVDIQRGSEQNVLSTNILLCIVIISQVLCVFINRLLKSRVNLNTTLSRVIEQVIYVYTYIKHYVNISIL